MLLPPKGVEDMYKAAGLLLVRRAGADVLLVSEYRRRGGGSTPAGLYWNVPSGKRDRADKDSLATAVREFCEETGRPEREAEVAAWVREHLLPANLLRHVYHPSSKYVLFLADVPPASAPPRMDDGGHENSHGAVEIPHWLDNVEGDAEDSDLIASVAALSLDGIAGLQNPLATTVAVRWHALDEALGKRGELAVPPYARSILRDSFPSC